MQKMLLWKNNFIWPIDSTSEVKHSLFIYYLCVKSFLLFFFRFLQFPLYFLIFFLPPSISIEFFFFILRWEAQKKGLLSSLPCYNSFFFQVLQFLLLWTAREVKNVNTNVIWSLQFDWNVGKFSFEVLIFKKWILKEI